MSEKEYTGSNIDSLNPVQQIRLRPGMWIGATDPYALFKEILDNSLDEHTAGYCNRIKVTLSDDKRTVSIRDFGRGIPVDNAKGRDKSALTIVFTELFSGGKFGKEVYMAAGGLHGVGLLAVNALSTQTEVIVFRNGVAYRQLFEKGIVKTAIQSKPTKNKNGTKITFTPDPEIFKNRTFTPETIKERIESITYLCSGLRIDFEHNGKIEEFETKGLPEYVDTFVKDKKKKFFEPLHFKIEQKCEYEDAQTRKIEKGIDIIEAAILYADEEIKEPIRSFCNTITTVDGGTHLDGFKSGLTIAMVELGKEAGYVFTKNEVFDGISACVHVLIPDPGYNSQSKDKLNTGRIEDIVKDVTIKQVKKLMKSLPVEVTSELYKKMHYSYELRLDKKDWKDLEKLSGNRKSGQRLNIDNFSDCISNDPGIKELYIVEGDSAKGTATMARDPRFQAVMAVQGKFTNAYKADLKSVFKNKDIARFSKILGCGISEKCDVDKVLYHKIIFSADADQDGMHIRCLALALLNSSMRPLLEAGMIYVAEPPLYGAINHKFKQSDTGETLLKNFKYSDDKDELIKMIGGKKRDDGTYDTGQWQISRYKGLGEVAANQLGVCIFNPETRKLKRITVNEFVEDDEYMTKIMGDDSNYRKEILYGTAKE